MLFPGISRVGNEAGWKYATLEQVETLHSAACRDVKTFLIAVRARTTKKIRAGLLAFVTIIAWLQFLSQSSSPTTPPPTHHQSILHPRTYNNSKLALLIEDRVTPPLIPLLLHFTTVVPPDWPFRFLGSNNTIAHLHTSAAIHNLVSIGKLHMGLIPQNMSTSGTEEISGFLTNLWVYETLLAPAEWVLVFQTDSMLCSNSARSLDEFLIYDWVGAPWKPSGKFGGNGGLSLRRVSSIVDVLRNQERPVGDRPEDVWLTERLGHRPNARLANGTISLLFSGEEHSGPPSSFSNTNTNTNNTTSNPKSNDRIQLNQQIESFHHRQGYYEPMGYHLGGSGSYLWPNIWGTRELREHIWRYCPEVKIMLQGQLDAEDFVDGDCFVERRRGLRDGDRSEIKGLVGW